MQERREREVRVARGIGTADLCARRLLGAGLVQRDPDEGRAVALRPRDVDGSLVAGHEPLVRVHPLREDAGHLACVHEEAGDEALRRLREVVLVTAVEELVAPAAEERHVRVHARAVLAEERLRHERRVVAVPCGDLLHDQPVRDRVVGHRERVRVAHVDLVLRGPDLVVVVLDRDADRLQRVDRVVADLRGCVLRRHREVAALVDRLRALVVLEDEVLELGPDVERVEAHALHAVERTSEDVARIALVGSAVGRDDVADHPRDVRADRVPVIVLGSRHELEARRIGDRDHVRLLDRVEPRDRRAVESHPVVQCLRHLRRRDRERLEVPFEVGEPEEDVLDTFVLDPLEHRAPCGQTRRRAILAPDHRPASLRPRSCHDTSLEMEKAPDGSAARGHVASQTARL